MKISNDFIYSLIDQENPVPAVGRELVKLWLNAASKENIGNFYYEGEKIAKNLEEFILKVFSEFYRLLAKSCVKKRAVFQKYDGASFVVMDGMSLREGVLIYKNLKGKGLSVKLDINYSSIPSDTEAYREKIGIPIKEFAQINNPENIRLFGNEKYIWSYFPDVMLDKIQVGHTVISSLEKMYRTTESIVEKVLSKLRSRKIIILSDHGYIRSEAGFVFSVPERAKKKLQSFFGSKRYIMMDNINPNDLVKEGRQSVAHPHAYREDKNN